MKAKKPIFLQVLVLSFLGMIISTTAYAGQLRFFLDGANTTYNEASSNPYFNEGLVTSDNDFLLNLVNMFKNKEISDVDLVLAIPKTNNFSNFNIALGNKTFTANDFINGNTGPHTYLKGNNAIYNQSYWLETSIGDLAKYNGSVGGSDTASLYFKIRNRPANFLLHVDAYGSTDKGPGAFVPYSEDLTVTPEPVGTSLFLFGSIAMALNAYRKKKLNTPA